MNFTLGFSPCPNDTFIFDALVNKKIDTRDINFNTVLEDVETLNRLALQNTLDFTKISYGVLPYLLKSYTVLDSGSALGSGVGPLLIAKTLLQKHEINTCTVVIPGENTTAHLLFSSAFSDAKNKKFIRYDEIENYVLRSSEEKVAGVIIHENRFTYKQKGLIKIVDLGDFWQHKTGYPIPLGGIVAKRSIDSSITKKIDGLIKKSIEFSFDNYPAISEYVQRYSQEMETDVMKKHIDLYVNKFSLSLGQEGRNAILNLLKHHPHISNFALSEGQVFIN